MALQSRKTTFSFQNNAENIRMEPIHFDRYEQFAERMDENQLIEYIMSEFNNFHSERMNDLTEMNNEYQNLDAMRQRMVNEVSVLENQAAQIREKQEAAEHKKADLETQRE